MRYWKSGRERWRLRKTIYSYFCFLTWCVCLCVCVCVCVCVCACACACVCVCVCASVSQEMWPDTDLWDSFGEEFPPHFIYVNAFDGHYIICICVLDGTWSSLLKDSNTDMEELTLCLKTVKKREDSESLSGALCTSSFLISCMQCSSYCYIIKYPQT
jgi:hypothetical protein